MEQLLFSVYVVGINLTVSLQIVGVAEPHDYRRNLLKNRFDISEEYVVLGRCLHLPFTLHVQQTMCSHYAYIMSIQDNILRKTITFPGGQREVSWK